MIKHPLSHAPYESIEFTALDRAIDAQRDAFKESISEAHKLGFETGRDKQLEQVIEWMKVNLMKHDFHEGYAYLYDDCSNAYIREEELLKDLREAMRPQEDN